MREHLSSVEGVYEALELFVGQPPPPEAWEIAIEKRYVAEYLQGLIDLESLSTHVEDLEDTLRKAQVVRGRQRETKPASEPQNYRRWALNEIFAIEAAESQAVDNFRRTWLAEGLLPLEGVADWVAHRREVEAPPSTWVTVLASEDGSPVADGNKQPGFRESFEMLQFVEADTEFVQTVKVNARGALYELKTITHSLTRRYDWSEAWAATFVLTGISPRARLARFTRTNHWPWYRARRSLTINVRLDVQPRQVMELYRVERNKMLEGEPRPRSIGALKARLGVFAAGHNQGFTWGQAMWKWNRGNPDHRFEDEARFTRDCRDAFLRITGEQLNWVGKAVEEREG